MKKLIVLIGFLGVIGSAIGMTEVAVATGNQDPRASFQTVPALALANVVARLSEQGFLTFIKEVPGPDRKEVVWNYFKNSANPTALIKALEIGEDGRLKNEDTLVDILSAIKANNALKPPHKLKLDRLNKNNETALMQMAKQGHFNALKILVNAGANLDRKDTRGNTALMLAIENEHQNIANYLVKFAAKVNILNNAGQTAVGIAHSKGYAALENMLIGIGANSGLRINQDVPLINEIINENWTQVKALIAAGADPNIQDNNGSTALKMAAGSGHTEAVKALIAAGAYPNIQNNYGWTALIVATKMGHTEIVELLDPITTNK